MHQLIIEETTKGLGKAPEGRGRGTYPLCWMLDSAFRCCCTLSCICSWPPARQPCHKLVSQGRVTTHLDRSCHQWESQTHHVRDWNSSQWDEISPNPDFLAHILINNKATDQKKSPGEVFKGGKWRDKIMGKTDVGSRMANINRISGGQAQWRGAGLWRRGAGDLRWRARRKLNQQI